MRRAYLDARRSRKEKKMKKFVALVLLVVLVFAGIFVRLAFMKNLKTDALQKDTAYYNLFPFGTFEGNPEDINAVKEMLFSFNARFFYSYDRYEYDPVIFSKYFSCSDNCKENVGNIDKAERYYLERRGLWNGKDKNVCISKIREEEILLNRKNLESAATYLEKCIEQDPKKVGKILAINLKAAQLGDFMEVYPGIIYESMPSGLRDEETREILDDLFLVSQYVDVYHTTPDKLKSDLKQLEQTIEKSESTAKSFSYYEEKARKYVNKNCIGIRIKDNKAYATILHDIIWASKFVELERTNGKWKICRIFDFENLSGKGKEILLKKAKEYLSVKP